MKDDSSTPLRDKWMRDEAEAINDASDGIARWQSTLKQLLRLLKRLLARTSQSSLFDLSANRIPKVRKPVVIMTNKILTSADSILPNTPPKAPAIRNPWNSVREVRLNASSRLSVQNLSVILFARLSYPNGRVNHVASLGVWGQSKFVGILPVRPTRRMETMQVRRWLLGIYQAARPISSKVTFLSVKGSPKRLRASRISMPASRPWAS